jgi:hypothetical protein
MARDKHGKQISLRYFDSNARSKERGLFYDKQFGFEIADEAPI